MTSSRYLASVILLSIPVLLAGCTSSKMPARPVAATSQKAVVDPVLSFVSSAKEGDETTILAPSDGVVTLRLEREYHAASDEVCRRYSMKKSVVNTQESRVACRGSNGMWSAASFSD